MAYKREHIGRVHVGKNVKYVRELRNMTQKELADKLGITQSAISQFEKSERMHDSTINNVADKLDIDELILEFEALYDELDPEHDALMDIIKNYHMEEQYERYIRAKNPEISSGKVSAKDYAKNEILNYFDMLNHDGKREAVKRVEELTLLDRYKKEV